MAKKIKDENGNVYKMKKPFYKKWWFIILAVLVVIGVATGGNGSKDSASKSSENTTTKEKSEKTKDTKPEEKIFKMGEDVKVGDMVYKVNNVEVTKQVGPSIVPTNAKDTFLLVDLTVTNNGNKAVTVDSSFFKLTEGEKTFDADAGASMSANQGEGGDINNSFFLQSLNPDVSLSGKIVFDVSEKQANSQANTLQVQTGAFGTETEKISLN